MLYLDIANELTSKILNNDFENTKKLPSELDLAKAYNTSKMTIRRALSLLIDSGIIFPVPKSGYYINDFEDIKKFNSLTGNSIAFLNKNSVIKSNVIFFEIVDTPDNLKNKFDSSVTKLIFLKRIRYLDDELTSIENTYLNYDLFRNFKKEIAEGSIYEYIHKQGYTIAANLKTLRPNFIPDEFLKYEPQLKGKPFIEIENLGYLTNGIIFEYSISYNIDAEYSTVIKFNNVLKNK